MMQHERPRRGKRTQRRIPHFETIEEAATFWDTHSLADFVDELEEVPDVQFVPYQPKRAITVRLPEDTLAVLAKEAHDKGIGLSTLARMWILERLRHGEPQP